MVNKKSDEKSKKAKETVLEQQQVQRLVKKEVEKEVKVIMASYSGPIPLPQHLAEYDKILSGSAERILAMAEKEQLHFHSIQKEETSTQKLIAEQHLAYFSRGQVFGFVISVLFLAAAVFLAMNEHKAVAMVLGGATVAGLTTAFVTGFLGQKKTDK